MIYPKLSDGTIDWCVMCKNEGDDFYDLCCECEYPENSDENSDDPPTKYEPKPMTNSDRIRAMSDEELAHFLEMKAGRFVSFYPTQAKSWLDWLRQEAHDA